MKGPFAKMELAEKEFAKKFKDKTKNNWDDRSEFVPAAGKYTLLEMAGSDDEEVSFYSSKVIFSYLFVFQGDCNGCQLKDRFQT